MTITWEQVLAFLCEEQTMAITSLLFLAFFAAVALINYALPRVLRPYFLLAASYGFFCYDPVNRPLVWVIAAATVLTSGLVNASAFGQQGKLLMPYVIATKETVGQIQPSQRW